MSSSLQSRYIKSWLKQRHNTTTKNLYLETAKERNRAEKIDQMFQSFDFDNDGQLDISEICNFFQTYGSDLKTK